ncbi:hypothetical protein HanIR_Chr11g0560221 [Helianthus annuus]|nr:hypothetical protein HanIR_Chr11g0560221 [Helianthus annuus]
MAAPSSNHMPLQRRCLVIASSFVFEDPDRSNHLVFPLHNVIGLVEQNTNYHCFGWMLLSQTRLQTTRHQRRRCLIC